MNNPNSSYDKGICADGQLHCNPALFGKNLCVDFSSKSARVRAYSNCNQKFKNQGRNIEDIIQEMTDHEFYKAVGTVENVCRNNDLKQSKTAMCRSILKKFESYVPSSRPKSQAKALDALKSTSADELTNALEDVLNELEQDKAQLDSKCSDQPIPPENEAFCTNVARRIIEAEKLAETVADKIEVIITNDNVNCGGLRSNPSEGQPGDLSRDVNNALVAQCTQEDIDARNQSCGQEIACSITSTLMGPVLAGYLSLTGGSSNAGKRQCLSSENDCLTNVLTSLVDYLISSVKAVWSLLGMGVDWVTEKGKDFWGWVTNAEDETSKTQEAIQNLSDRDIKEIEEDSEGWFKKTLTGITSMLNEWIKTEVFCEKWSGAPNFSTCQQPMKGWDCLGCGTMINGMCRMAGPAIGLIAETVLTGGALAVISKGAKGVKAGIAAMKSSPKYMATIKRVQNTGFAQKLNKAKEAVITSSRLPKGQPLKYTKELLAKVAQLSKDRFSKIKNSGVVTKAKEILKKLSETKLAKAVKKVDEVDSKALKAGYESVDKTLDKAGNVISKTSKASKLDSGTEQGLTLTTTSKKDHANTGSGNALNTGKKRETSNNNNTNASSTNKVSSNNQTSTLKRRDIENTLKISDDLPSNIAKFRSDLHSGSLTGDNRFVSYIDPISGKRLAGIIEPIDISKLQKTGGKVEITKISSSGATQKVNLNLDDLKDVRFSNTALAEKTNYLNHTRRSGAIDTDIAQDLLRELELSPAKVFKSESGANVTLSKPFQDSGGRVFVVAEITENGKTFYQTMYRSNSQSVFRVMPARNKGVNGYPGYDKGPGEELLTVSPEFQKEITQVVGRQRNLKTRDPEELDGVLQVNRGWDDYEEYLNSADYIRKPQGKTIELLQESSRPLNDMAGRSFSRPEDLIIKDKALKPNYSQPRTSYSFESPVYGKVEAKVYRSNDGSVEYTLLKDEKNRVWFGDIANTSKSNNSRGLRSGNISEDLSHPLWEYHYYDNAGNVKYSQIPGASRYAGQNHPTHSSYSDMWRYIKEIPEIQRWYKENNIPIPK